MCFLKWVSAVASVLCSKRIQLAAIRIELLLPLLVILAMPAMTENCLLFGQEGQQPIPSLDTILSEWSKRQASVNSARFKWTEQQFWKQGSVTPPANPTGGVHPSEDAVFSVTEEFSFHGSKWRYSSKRKIWSVHDRKWVDDPFLITCDGGKTAQLQFGGLDSFPRGFIKKPGAEVNTVTLWPITQTYRLLHAAFLSFERKDLRMTDRRGVIRGQSCLILERSDRDPANIITFWVAEQRGYPILRYSSSDGVREVTRVEVEYKDDAKYGPVPIRWTISSYDNKGLLRRTFTASVDSFEMNPSIPEEAFQMQFPPTAIISDQRDGPTKFFYVKQDGSLRLFPTEDNNATREQLETTEPGLAHFSRPSRFPGLLFIGFLVVVLLIALSYLFHRYRRRVPG